MSDGNAEIVRRHIEAWTTGEGTLALSFLDPHIVLDVTRTGAIEGAFYGTEGVVEHARRYQGTFEDYRWKVRRLDDLGTGAVLALVTQSGRGKGSGASVEGSLAALYTVLDGKIVRITMFQGEKEALEAAGLSEENVDAIRAVYERWGEGDFEAGLDLLDPHAVLVHDPEFEAGGPSYGINAITEFTRGVLEAWTRFTISAEEVIPAGDSVLVGVHQRGVGRASGVPADLHYFMVWTFRGHKVVRFESIRERAKALEAAGLSE